MDSVNFINSLPDSRYLLIYPELVKKLSILIQNMNDNDLKNIFPDLTDYLDPNKRNGIIDIINTSCLTILTHIFPTLLYIDFLKYDNSKVPRLSKKLMDSLVFQAGVPFTSNQFLLLLNLLKKEDLDMIIATLKDYQLKDLSAMTEKFETLFNLVAIGVL